VLAVGQENSRNASAIEAFNDCSRDAARDRAGLRTRFRKFAHLLERGGLGAKWARRTASATKSLDFGDAKFYLAIALVWLATYMEAVSNVVKKLPSCGWGLDMQSRIPEAMRRSCVGRKWERISTLQSG
jgi:hypothetical protein